MSPFVVGPDCEKRPPLLIPSMHLAAAPPRKHGLRNMINSMEPVNYHYPSIGHVIIQEEKQTNDQQRGGLGEEEEYLMMVNRQFVDDVF